jgi:hypothetical protein
MQKPGKPGVYEYALDSAALNAIIYAMVKVYGKRVE